MTSLEFVILALAAYRTWALLAEDNLAGPVRERLGKRSLAFVACPWCLGFWVSAGWSLAFWADHRSVWVAVPFALSTAVAAVAAVMDASVGE